MDVERRVPHRVFAGVEPITSLAASADGRRLVATVTRSTSGLWRVPIGDRVMEESDAAPLSLPTAGGLSPRIHSGSIFYRGSKAGRDGLWKLAAGGAATELWNGVNGRVMAEPAVASDGRLAFVVRRRGLTELYVMNGDATAIRRIADGVDVRGAPAWSPDGQWLAVAAANREGMPQIFKIPIGGGSPVLLVKEYSTDPILGTKRPLSGLLRRRRRDDVFGAGRQQRWRAPSDSESDALARRPASGLPGGRHAGHHEG
jgi:hypothetical protein